MTAPRIPLAVVGCGAVAASHYLPCLAVSSRLARSTVVPSAADLAASLVVMVAQVIATLAITAARSERVALTVVTGHLADMRSMRRQMARVGEFYGHPLTLPPGAGKATALGALAAGFAARRDEYLSEGEKE